MGIDSISTSSERGLVRFEPTNTYDFVTYVA